MPTFSRSATGEFRGDVEFDRFDSFFAAGKPRATAPQEMQTAAEDQAYKFSVGRHEFVIGNRRSEPSTREPTMGMTLPRLFLARHGDTAWTDAHKHTGRTDVPLNERGEERAQELGKGLKNCSFSRVFTSPLQRASKTCELAGFGRVAEIEPDLVEWDYGRWEGMRTHEILEERPGWELFRDGSEGGESPEDVATRADRFVDKVQRFDGDVLAFSSGHIIRMIAARWLGLPPHAGRAFYCEPASVGVLGFEHDQRDERVLRLWNRAAEVGGSF